MASLRFGGGVRLLMSLATFVVLVTTFVRVDSTPQIEGRLFGIETGNPLELYTNRKGNKLNLRSVRFDKCGGNNNSVMLHTFRTRHNSNGDVILNVTLSINTDIEGPLKMNVKLLKRVGDIHMEIPCLFGIFGSCTSSDLCRFGQETCPLKVLEYQGFPCKCPIKRGTYRLRNAVFPLPRIPHTEMLQGNYIITVTLSNQKGTLSCYKFFMNVDVFPMPE